MQKKESGDAIDKLKERQEAEKEKLRMELQEFKDRLGKEQEEQISGLKRGRRDAIDAM